jgi:hypothetical protein
LKHLVYIYSTFHFCVSALRPAPIGRPGSGRTVGRSAWGPIDGDVRLRIWLNGIAFGYRATVTAAYQLICDWQRRPWCSIELVVREVDDRLPMTRLPNERLFSGP